MNTSASGIPFPKQKLDHALAMFLRVVGIADLLALIAVFLPGTLLESTHEFVGLGALPDGRIVGYLARSTSLLYAINGALLLFLATDVARYRPVIRCYGTLILTAGVLLLGVDIAEAMPLWWTFFESGAVCGIGLVILLLSRSATVDAKPLLDAAQQQ